MYKYGLGGHIAISGSVHRSLNDVVGRITKNQVSGWEGNYEIILCLDGQINACATEQNTRGLNFQSTLTEKLVFLPTPEWVQNSEQNGYICFYYELEGFMRKWWKEYARHLG